MATPPPKPFCLTNKQTPQKHPTKHKTPLCFKKTKNKSTDPFWPYGHKHRPRFLPPDQHPGHSAQALRQHLYQLSHGILRLGDRHTIARHNDDLPQKAGVVVFSAGKEDVVVVIFGGFEWLKNGLVVWYAGFRWCFGVEKGLLGGKQLFFVVSRLFCLPLSSGVWLLPRGISSKQRVVWYFVRTPHNSFQADNEAQTNGQMKVVQKWFVGSFLFHRLFQGNEMNISSPGLTEHQFLFAGHLLLQGSGI